MQSQLYCAFDQVNIHMGNIPSTTSDRSYQVQLGESAVIHLGGGEVKQQANGEVTESWQVSYKVDNSTFDFSLTSTTGTTKGTLDIRITDGLYGGAKADRCFSVVATKTRAGIDFQTDSKTADDNSRTTAVCALGGIGETKVHIYGQGRRRCLMVWESTKKSVQHLKPYMLTVAHYYANSENGRNIGISIAVQRISVSEDGRLDFVVDGPVQHPAAALFHMFDQVLKTGTWKPTYCSHCSDPASQRQRASIIRQSESEDSHMDNVSSPRLFTPRLDGLRQNGKGIDLVNDEKIKGYNNGNCTIINSCLQSEIKDSDRGSVPAPRLHGRRQNGGNIILANDGNKLNASGFLLQPDESEDRHDVPTTNLHGRRRQNGGPTLANDIGTIHGNHCGNDNPGKAYIVSRVLPAASALAYLQQKHGSIPQK